MERLVNLKLTSDSAFVVSLIPWKVTCILHEILPGLSGNQEISKTKICQNSKVLCLVVSDSL